MKTIGKLFGILALTFLLSCDNSSSEKSEKKEEVKKLKEEVMHIHDSIMPQMNKVIELKSKLRQGIDDSAYVSPEMRDSAKSIMKRLEKADKAMSEWMHNYEPPKLDTGVADAKQYLQKQKEKISKVQHVFKKSIEDANELLKNNDKEEGK